MKFHPIAINSGKFQFKKEISSLHQDKIPQDAMQYFATVHTTNGFELVVSKTALTASSFIKSDLVSSHAAVINGTFGTMNGSN